MRVNTIICFFLICHLGETHIAVTLKDSKSELDPLIPSAECATTAKVSRTLLEEQRLTTTAPNSDWKMLL